MSPSTRTPNNPTPPIITIFILTLAITLLSLPPASSSSSSSSPPPVFPSLIEATEKILASRQSSVSPLVLRRVLSGSQVDELFGTRDDLTSLIEAATSPDHPECSMELNRDVKVVRRTVDEETGEPWTGVVEVGSSRDVFAAMAAGNTLVVNRIQDQEECQEGRRLIDGVRRVSRVVEEGAYPEDPVVGSVNMYFSSPSKAGFEAHFDLMDVVIVHLGGRKTWSVYTPQVWFPLPDMAGRPEFDSLDLLGSFDLFPGDVLFLPRGYIHEARAVGSSPSVHLTFGFEVYNATYAFRALPCTLPQDDSFHPRLTPTELPEDVAASILPSPLCPPSHSDL